MLYFEEQILADFENIFVEFFIVVVETMTINALYLIIGVLLVVILVGVIVLLWWKLGKHHAMAGLTTKPTWHVNSKDITLFECDDNENPAADNISLYSQVNSRNMDKTFNITSPLDFKILHKFTRFSAMFHYGLLYIQPM